MYRLALGVVALGLIASLSAGCSQYTVKPTDREDFTMAKGVVAGGLETVKGSQKPATTDGPEGQAMREVLRTREGQIGDTLNKPKLTLPEVRDVSQRLVSYREGYDQLVDSALKDDQVYLFSPESQAKLQESRVRLQETLNRINQGLNSYIEGQKLAFERRVRGTMQTVGSTLGLLEKQYLNTLDQKILAAAGDPQKSAQLKKQKADFLKAVGGWLKAVDGQLKTLVATSELRPSFLMSADLVNAVKLTFDPDEKKNWTQWIEVTVPIALGFVEGLVPEATRIGEDAVSVLRIVSEEFTKLVEKFENQGSGGVPA